MTRCRRWTGRIPLGLGTWPPQNGGWMLRDEREQARWPGGGPCALQGGSSSISIPLPPAPSSRLHSGALQSGGQGHGCLRPALTSTQLCDDTGRCHPQVWTTSSKRLFSTAGFCIAWIVSRGRFQTGTPATFEPNPLLKRADTPNWGKATVTSGISRGVRRVPRTRTRYDWTCRPPRGPAARVTGERKLPRSHFDGPRVVTTSINSQNRL